MRFANLTGAQLSNSTFAKADVTGAIILRTGIGNALTVAQIYSTTSYQQHDLRGVGFGGDLTGADLTGQDLRGAYFGYSTLVGADFRGAQLDGSVFKYATLQNANLQQLNLSGADFSDSRLDGVNLRQAELNGAKFMAADLTGADFTGAQIKGADLSRRRYQHYGGIGYQEDFQGTGITTSSFTRRPTTMRTT